MHEQSKGTHHITKANGRRGKGYGLTKVQSGAIRQPHISMISDHPLQNSARVSTQKPKFLCMCTATQSLIMSAISRNATRNRNRMIVLEYAS